MKDNNTPDRLSVAQAKTVLDEALRRGYDRHTDQAEWVHCRDLQLALEQGSTDHRAMHSLLEIMQVQDAFSPKEDYQKAFLPDPDPVELAKGELECFETLESVPVRHRAAEQTLSMRIFARFGAGKSSAEYGIIKTNIENGHSCLVVDSKGQQFDSLLRLLPGRILKLKVGRDCILNPFKYPDIAIPTFCRHCGRFDSQVLWDIGSLMLRNSAPGRLPEPVTFSRLVALIPKVHMPRGIPDIKDTLRQSLIASGLEVFSSPVFNSINCLSGLEFSAMIKAKPPISAVIDTSDIAGTDMEHWFVTALLQSAREDIRNDPVLSRTPGNLLLFAVDEATAIGASVKFYIRGLHPFAQTVSLCRGSGLSVLLCYHSPNATPEILHSGGIMLCGSLVNGPDIMAVKKAMFLTDPQAQALTQLPVGHGIMLIAGRCPRVFLVRWRDFPSLALPTDSEIARNNLQVLARLPRIVPDPFRLERLLCPSLAASSSLSSSPDASAARGTLSDLASDEDILYLFKHLEDNPFLNLSERCKALTFPSGIRRKNYKQLLPILNDLQTRKQVGSVSVQMSSRGSVPGSYWFLTAETRTRFFGTSGLKRGGTGPAHNLVVRIVHKILADRGVESHMEAFL